MGAELTHTTTHTIFVIEFNPSLMFSLSFATQWTSILLIPTYRSKSISPPSRRCTKYQHASATVSTLSHITANSSRIWRTSTTGYCMTHRISCFVVSAIIYSLGLNRPLPDHLTFLTTISPFAIESFGDSVAASQLVLVIPKPLRSGKAHQWITRASFCSGTVAIVL